MEQEKIGKFIATCRKEAGFTQASLAEKLGITDRAVSKWETGKSLPDASIMLELCELLKINVNELLFGEHISMDDYQEKAESQLLELKEKLEKSHANMLTIEKYMGIIGIPIMVAMVIAGAFSCKAENYVTGVILIVFSLIMLIGLCVVGLKIEHDAGYYECPNCGERYVPTMSSVVWALHIGRDRKMKCPYCNEKGYHKKVISKK
ncbi:MAG: helix-turn-helix transcriptional regulator [Ruminococcaceae bacterium]|nr:helix-turn-helix transcriptional regulator [Oscillospiraceae bacterium]